MIILNYLFWEILEPLFGFEFFEAIQALFILLLCLYIFLGNRKLFISFFLLCSSVNNLIDELTNDWMELYLSELLLLVIIPITWKYYKIKYARQNRSS